MRAKEFTKKKINKKHKGKLGRRRHRAMRGLNVFKDSEGWNTDYVLNRVMMAVASTDGKSFPDVDQTSWIGKQKSAHPYTQEEQDMLKMAYRAVGAEYKDLNHGDMRSQELENINTTSPIKGFKGYKRK